MRKFGSMPPAREQPRGLRRIGGEKFDRGFADARRFVIRQEYGAAFISTDKFAQAEFTVDDLAYPFFRGVGHPSLLHRSERRSAIPQREPAVAIRVRGRFSMELPALRRKSHSIGLGVPSSCGVSGWVPATEGAFPRAAVPRAPHFATFSSGSRGKLFCPLLNSTPTRLGRPTSALPINCV